MFKEFTHIVNKEGQVRNAIASIYTREEIIKKFVCFCGVTFKYRVYDKVSDFVDELGHMDQIRRTFHEVIFGHAPQRLKFDIDDYNGPDFDAAIAELVVVIHDIYEMTYGDVLDDADVVICRSIGKKPSAHIIIRKYVASNLEAAEFTKKVAEVAKIELDLGCNKSIQNFRIATCHKGDERIKKIMTPHTIYDTLIGCYDEDVLILPAFVTKAPSQPNAVKIDTDVVLAVAGRCGIMKHNTFRGIKGNSYEFDRFAPSMCELCNHVHDKDNTVVLVVHNGTIFKNCRKHAGGGVPIGSIISDGDVVEKLNFDEQIEKKINDVIVTSPTLFDGLKSRIVYNEPKLRPFDATADCLFVHANMKMGKTKALKEYVAAMSADAVIRFISFRQTFSGNIKAAFDDFILYSDVKGQMDAALPRVIVQVESLHRLDVKKVDLVILDECEAIFEQFDSGNLREFNLCWAKFQWLMRYSKKIICMDALLSDRSYRVVHRMRYDLGDTSLMSYHHNTYQNACEDSYYLTGDKLKWLGILYASVEADEKIAVPVSSLIEAKVLMKNLTRKYPAKSIKLYSSETSATEKKAHFADVARFWMVDVLIYTPTVTAGVSFEVKWFDKLFGYFTDLSCPVETVVQMIGRIRDVRSKKFFICMLSMGNNLPVTIDDIKTMLYSKRENLVRTFDETGLRPEYGPTGELIYHTSDYFYLWAENQICKNLSRNNFTKRLIMQISVSGAKCHTMSDAVFLEYVGCDYTPEAVEDISADHALVRGEIKDEQVINVASADDLDAESVERITNAIITQDDIEPADRAAYNRHRLRVDYKYDGIIDVKFVKKYMDNGKRRAYKNLCRIGKGSAEDLQRIQSEERATHQYLMANIMQANDLNRKYVYDQHRYALGLIKICGFSSLYDAESKHLFTLAAVLKENEALYWEIIRSCCVEFGFKSPCMVTVVANRENDDAYVKLILAVINKVLGIMYDCKIAAKLDKDIYSICHTADFSHGDGGDGKPCVSS